MWVYIYMFCYIYVYINQGFSNGWVRMSPDYWTEPQGPPYATWTRTLQAVRADPKAPKSGLCDVRNPRKILGLAKSWILGKANIGDVTLAENSACTTVRSHSASAKIVEVGERALKPAPNWCLHLSCVRLDVCKRLQWELMSSHLERQQATDWPLLSFSSPFWNSQDINDCFNSAELRVPQTFMAELHKAKSTSDPSLRIPERKWEADGMNACDLS